MNIFYYAHNFVKVEAQGLLEPPPGTSAFPLTERVKTKLLHGLAARSACLLGAHRGPANAAGA